MRFHLIDQLVSFDKWEKATAVKNVTFGQNLFLENDLSFSNSLILESIFQTAAWLIVISSEQKYRPAIVSFENFKVKRSVEIGEKIRIEVSIESIDKNNVFITGNAFVDSENIASIDHALLHLLETRNLENMEETTIYLSFLTRQVKE